MVYNYLNIIRCLWITICVEFGSWRCVKIIFNKTNSTCIVIYEKRVYIDAMIRSQVTIIFQPRWRAIGPNTSPIFFIDLKSR